MIDQVKRLIERHFNEIPLSITEVTQGSWEKNRGSFLVELKEKRVKVIILPTESRIKEIVEFCKILKELTPKILHSDKNYMITEWLAGTVFPEEDLPKTIIQEVAEFQARLHKQMVSYNDSEIIEDTKRQIQDTLNFVLENNKILPDEFNFLQNYFEMNFPESPEISLIHGDFNIDNLIKTNYDWKSIDNERLHISLTGMDLDKPLKNICQTEENKKIYLDAYDKIKPIKFYKKDEIFYRLLFYLHRLRLMIKYKKDDRILKEQKRLRNVITSI